MATGNSATLFVECLQCNWEQFLNFIKSELFLTFEGTTGSLQPNFDPNRNVHSLLVNIYSLLPIFFFFFFKPLLSKTLLTFLHWRHVNVVWGIMWPPFSYPKYVYEENCSMKTTTTLLSTYLHDCLHCKCLYNHHESPLRASEGLEG